jgi:hypothetical protein
MEVLIPQLMIDWLEGSNTSQMAHLPQIQTLIKSQTAIGIHHLFLGRWSNLRQQYQLQYVDRQNITKSPQNHGTLWASTLIRLIWHQKCQEGWKIRNKDKHGAIKDTQIVVNKLEVAKCRIHALYKLKPLCFPAVRRTKWFFMLTPKVTFSITQNITIFKHGCPHSTSP